MSAFTRRLPQVHAMIVLSALAGAPASAQVIDAAFPAPALDRWMYPFNPTPGTRPTASTFAAPAGDEQFDDADAQFLVAYDTGGQVPSGLGTAAYTIQSARLRAWVANSSTELFAYDNTADPLESHLPTSDPSFVADADPGRPIMLFGTAYREGFTALTFTETTEFSSIPFPTVEGVRRAFAAAIDAAGAATDVSNFVRDRFETQPWAIATTASVAPGQFVPTNAEFVFEIDANDPAVQAELARGLDRGRIPLSIVAMFPATGGPGGGAGNYPRWYCKEHVLAVPPLGALTARLELTVRLGGCEADLTTTAIAGAPGYGQPNGVLNNDDFFYYLALFAAAEPGADLTTTAIPGAPGYGTPDGTINNDDFFYYLALFAAGC